MSAPYRPLEGLRVLDFSRLLPGPLAGRLLADQGAEVIKVEAPDSPDPVRQYPPFTGKRSAYDLALNAGKRAVLIDARRPEGRDLLLDLVAGVDVLLESFRPGVLDAAGLGWAACRARNPRLVYASVTGYGQDGPWADRAGHDLNYQATAGLLHWTRDAEGRPVHPGLQLADVAGGAFAVHGAILAALWRRERTGEGHRVDLSMTDAALPLSTLQAAAAVAARQAGLPDRPPAAEPLAGGLAHYGLYRCRDGGWVALGALEPKFWMRFCAAAGVPEWAARMGFDPEGQAALRRDLEDLFAARDREDWLRLGERADCCLTAVVEPDGLAEQPALRARGALWAVAAGVRPSAEGPNEVTQQPDTLPLFPAPGLTGASAGPPPPAPLVAPEPGRDTLEVLTSMGLEEARLRTLARDGVIAGPGLAGE